MPKIQMEYILCASKVRRTNNESRGLSKISLRYRAEYIGRLTHLIRNGEVAAENAGRKTEEILLR